jgi:sulfate permease, SulP family
MSRPIKIFHGFDKKFIKGDIYGGVTAGIIALPLGLAWGAVSGLGPLTGIYSSIIVGFLAALFGGTPGQISGPTGPMVVIIAAAFLEFRDQPEIVFFCVTFSGLIQILIGIFRLGNLINKIPYCVCSGFMSGVGLIIISLQLTILFGLGAKPQVISALANLQNISNVNGQALLIGSFGLLILFFIPKKISKIIPSTIIALIIGSILSYLFFSKQELIGEIPKGLPTLHFTLPKPDQYSSVLFYSIALALVGVIDSLLTAVVHDRITFTKHLPNKESIGQGIGNFFAGLFGALAATGAAMRTVVNLKTGGKTPVSGIIHSITLTLVIFVLAPLVKAIPLAILAAILIKTGLDIIDWEFLTELKGKSKTEVYTKFIVMILTMFTNLIFSVVAGVIFYYLIKLTYKNRKLFYFKR